MKVSQKQAQLLAKEIVTQLKQQNVGEVSEEVKKSVIAWKKRYNELAVLEQKAREETRKFEGTFKKAIGSNKNIRSYHTVDEILKHLKEGNTPSLSEIEDEIILKSMFSDEADMQKFIESVIARYEKKEQRKTQLN